MAYLELPWGSKFHHALSNDETRPTLTCAHLRKQGDDWELLGSDSYMLARVRLTLVPDAGPDPVEGPISAAAMRAISKAGAFRADSDTVQVLCRHGGTPTGVRFDRHKLEKSLGEISDKLWRHDEPTLTFALSPRLLELLARSLGGHRLDGVELRVWGPLDAIEVRPLGGGGRDERSGLLMPIRITHGDAE